ncbi:MAG: hypothetical protein P8M72_06205 [Gammaproteobacteria bacterium]|nr:hypothetical protein [Gammaproteobacteria bacterium]
MLWGTNLTLLTIAMQMEWLVIGSGLMFMPLLLVPPSSQTGNRIRTGVFLLLSLTFGMGAHSMNGWNGVFSFYTLLVIGYGGNVLLIKDLQRSYWLAIEFCVRWFVSMVIFFSLFVYFDPPQSIENWQGDASLLPYGAVFFSVLFVLELSLYSWAFLKLGQLLFGKQ